VAGGFADETFEQHKSYSNSITLSSALSISSRMKNSFEVFCHGTSQFTPCAT
jgi:hypothetical protein